LGVSDFERLNRRKNTKQMIDDEAFRRIHDESVGILEDVGIRIYSALALNLLEAHGATVDKHRMVARLPRSLVERAVETAPKELRLSARNPKYDLHLDRSHLYFTFDGCGVQTVDMQTGTRRPARKQDIVDCARLANVLPGVGYFTPSVAPQDVPLHAHVLHQMEAAYSNTDKFVVSESTTTAAEARAQIEIAAAVAGGLDELRRRPTLSAIVCAVPPLNLDGGGSEAAIEFAKAGVPVIMMSMVEAGVSGPVTLAGTLAVSNAEVLAMLTLTQCAREGAPAIYGSVLSMMQPRTGAYVSGAPEAALLCSAVVDLGRHYGLPTQAGTFGTNAPIPGSQAATEHCLTTLLAVEEGAEMVNGFGLLDASTVLSFEQLLLDYEIVTEVLHIAKGIDVDDGTLVPELIREVGIGGTYLAKRHTLANLREAWEPIVFEYGTYEEWVRKGSVDPARRAHDKAEALLSSAPSIPLPPDIGKSVREIVDRGERELRA